MTIIKKIIENILFYATFLIARIPVWFILILCLYHKTISNLAGIYIIIAIIIARGYMESEIVKGEAILQTFIQVFRVIWKIAILFILYGIVEYFGLYAKPVDQILGAIFLIIVISLMIENGPKKIGKFSIYFRGYHLPFLSAIVKNLFWIYLSFITDSLIGNILMIVSIYGIEIYNLFKRYNVPEYAEIF